MSFTTFTTWMDIGPALLIGLCGGAAISRLLGAGDQKRPGPAPIWLGLLGAVTLTGSLAGVIAFAAPSGGLSGQAQPAIIGLLAVFAAALTLASMMRGWLRARAPWAVAGAVIVIPPLAAGATAAALAALAAGGAAPAAPMVTITSSACAPGWTSASAGTRRFTVENRSGLPGEINLDDASGNIAGEIESIGPGTRAQLTATLGSGIYVFKCFMGSRPATASAPVRVTATGASATASPIAVRPVTLRELAGPNKLYQGYAARQLTRLAQAVTRIQADLDLADLAAAKHDWLAAQLDWERVGASYDSFGDLGLAVDGLPAGLPHGVSDQRFTGLHRLEYGLWHGQSAAGLLPVAAALAANVAALAKNLRSDDLTGDPANLPLRAHEILEDALRDHLSGLDDEGGGAAFAQTYADAQVTRAVLSDLAPLINPRRPGLPDIAASQLGILARALLATRAGGRWESLSSASLAAREQVDGALGALLETLSAIPDLLEIPPARP